MKQVKFILFTALVATTGIAQAQKISTKVIDNKGTIKWVLDSSSAVITKADSTILYVTPTQLNQNLNNFVKYADTSSMLAPYLNNALNGLTKSGQSVKLGGSLTEVTTIATTATNFLQITGLTAGSNTDSVLVVNPSTGQLKIVSTATLFTNLKAGNGLTKVGDTLKLGGTLTMPTTITASPTNTFAIDGLQSGSTNDSIVVADPTTGVLKRRATTSLLQSGDQSFTATTGTLTYTVTNMPNEVNKVWVFRNGAKLLATNDYTVSSGVVTLIENGYTVTTGDVIEVQWVK